MIKVKKVLGDDIFGLVARRTDHRKNRWEMVSLHSR
jgi:hypothetical protein